MNVSAVRRVGSLQADWQQASKLAAGKHTTASSKSRKQSGFKWCHSHQTTIEGNKVLCQPGSRRGGLQAKPLNRNPSIQHKQHHQYCNTKTYFKSTTSIPEYPCSELVVAWGAKGHSAIGHCRDTGRQGEGAQVCFCTSHTNGGMLECSTRLPIRKCGCPWNSSPPALLVQPPLTMYSGGASLTLKRAAGTGFKPPLGATDTCRTRR